MISINRSTFYRVGFCFILILFSRGAIVLGQDAQRAFAQVERLRELAQEAYDKERATPTDRTLRLDRIQRYREVSKALLEYMKTYMADKQALNYLNNLYVLGAVSEGSENFGDAQSYYKECLEHPRIRDAQATYNGKPIFDLVNARLRTVQSATNRGGGGGGGVGAWSRARLMRIE